MIDQLNQQALYSLQLLLGFTYYYPLFMAYLWSIGAIWFYLRNEYGQRALPILKTHPRVSIVVPCYNEEPNVRETIGHLLTINYPDYEIIAINDGSVDKTGLILDELANTNGKIRVIHNAKNQGKSISLNTAAMLASGEIIVGIDGDALLDHNAIPWFIAHFESNEKIGAVTGNPRIRTRSTLIGRLQVGEFSSLVGLIKRAQRVFYRRVFTASGVITAFRRNALEDVGYWSPNMLTEDMDITWKLQLRHWDVRFEPRALAWILMPETVNGLWRQRLRWAMGGLQIVGKYKYMFLNWRNYSMWPLYFEHIISVIWACSVTTVLATYVLDLLVTLSKVVGEIDGYEFNSDVHQQSVVSLTAMLPEFSGVIIGTTCLLQMLLGMSLDRHYDQSLLRYYVWIIWYPLGFWVINMLTIIVALPMTIFRKSGLRARWVSPDRGVGS
ncbi:MAG: poly-beta-1,6-N-acetyl-D-glucosamine synthase [Nitrosomonas sp.]